MFIDQIFCVLLYLFIYRVHTAMTRPQYFSSHAYEYACMMMMMMMQKGLLCTSKQNLQHEVMREN